jgi:hypothetical protein
MISIYNVPNREKEKNSSLQSQPLRISEAFHGVYLHMYSSGLLSLTPHIAKSFSGYELCTMVAAGNAVPMAFTPVGPSRRGTNHHEVTFALSCTNSRITPLKAKRLINAGSNSPSKPNAEQQ